MTEKKYTCGCEVCEGCFHYGACLGMDVEGHMLDIEKPEDCGEYLHVSMTPNEFTARMQAFKEECIDIQGDEEIAHLCMDRLMVGLLEELGYEDGVNIFKNAPKYYA